MFSILLTSLTDKPLILQWEVWLRSLLGLKGLNNNDEDEIGLDTKSKIFVQYQEI